MEPKSYSLNRLNDMSQGDKEFVQSMLVMFVENVINSIDMIRPLKTAENWRAIGEIAHKLASNFAYLDSGSLQEIAIDIERSTLIHNNLTGIADKIEKMCNDAVILVTQIKSDFDFFNT